jgi:hypothetical protein
MFEWSELTPTAFSSLYDDAMSTFEYVGRQSSTVANSSTSADAAEYGCGNVIRFPLTGTYIQREMHA